VNTNNYLFTQTRGADRALRAGGADMTYRTAVLAALAASLFAAAPANATPASASVSGVFTFDLVDLAPNDGVTPYIQAYRGYGNERNGEASARSGYSTVATAAFENSEYFGTKLTHSVASGFVADATSDPSHAHVAIDNSGFADAQFFEHGARASASTSGAFTMRATIDYREVLRFSPNTRVTVTFTPDVVSQAQDLSVPPTYLAEEFYFYGENGGSLSQRWTTNPYDSSPGIHDKVFSFETAATGDAQGNLSIFGAAYAKSDFDGIPPVPEPGTWAMFAAGATVLGLRGKRRQRLSA
jgi:hypothetical protein